MTVSSLMAYIEYQKERGHLFDNSEVVLDINGTDLIDCKNAGVATNEENTEPILVLWPHSH